MMIFETYLHCLKLLTITFHTFFTEHAPLALVYSLTHFEIIELFLTSILGVLYFTRLHSEHSRALLETALTTFLASNADASIKVLYKWYYEQQASGQAETSLDLAFADDMLDVVEKQWREVVGDSEEAGEFMKFEERNDMGEENDAGEEY